MSEIPTNKEYSPDCLCWHCKMFETNRCPATYKCPPLEQLGKIRKVVETRGERGIGEILELATIARSGY